MFGETVTGKEARAKVAVDHAHRRVAEHQRQDSAAVNLGGDFVSTLSGFHANWRRVMQLIRAIGNRTTAAPFGEPVHERLVRGPIRGIGPDSRTTAIDAFQTSGRIEQSDQAGPGAGEIAGQQQRVVLADDAVASVRPVCPVNEDADHWVVDWAEL